MFRLFCYVRDDNYKQAFPVKIEEDEDVAALKNAIKEEKGKTFMKSTPTLLSYGMFPFPTMKTSIRITTSC
jgi:hypothetical protein